ncbi:trypco2 family protein [Kribbella sp. NPDC049174]|uniref:trypco2 family protein n=1 Tax=Kribbella sp. NPDC049174 TaxID=3364112 RepID=UPI0037240888
MSSIGLGEAIKALRDELTEAKGAGEGSWMRFQVSPVELELQVVVTKDANGKIGWKVVEAGAAFESARTQRVTLILTPQWWNPTKGQYSADWLVSGLMPAAEGDPMQSASPGELPETDSAPEDEK